MMHFKQNQLPQSDDRLFYQTINRNWNYENRKLNQKDHLVLKRSMRNAIWTVIKILDG